MKNYWTCIIGPVERDDLPWGADAILRGPIQRAFEKMCSKLDIEANYTCSSGWGTTEEMKQDIFYADCDDATKKMLIKSYYSEGKDLPRGLRAWELLFKEEEKS